MILDRCSGGEVRRVQAEERANVAGVHRPAGHRLLPRDPAQGALMMGRYRKPANPTPCVACTLIDFIVALSCAEVGVQCLEQGTPQGG